VCGEMAQVAPRPGVCRGSRDTLAAAFSVVSLVHRAFADPQLASPGGSYHCAWLLYLDLAGLLPLGSPPARRVAAPDPAARWDLATLAGAPPLFRLAVCFLAVLHGPLTPTVLPHTERPILARLRQGLWPGRRSGLARQWQLAAVVSLLFGANPASSALRELGNQVRGGRRWQLAVGPELRYVLQVQDSIAEAEERSVLCTLQDVASTEHAERPALRAQVLQLLGAAEERRPLLQLKGLGPAGPLGSFSPAAHTLCAWAAKELLPHDYLLPYQVPSHRFVKDVLQALAPKAALKLNRGRGYVPDLFLTRGLPGLLYCSQVLEVTTRGQLGVVLSEGPLRYAWLLSAWPKRPVTAGPELLEQEFANSCFKAALQFLSALLWPLPMELAPCQDQQCQDQQCLACCLVRCAGLLQGQEFSGAGPPSGDIQRAFQVLGQGRSAGSPGMPELPECVSDLLAKAVATEEGSPGCNTRAWLQSVCSGRIIELPPVPATSPLSLLTLQDLLDTARPTPGLFFLPDEKGRPACARSSACLLLEAQGFALDVEHTTPSVFVRSAVREEPVEFWLEALCFCWGRSSPARYVVVRRNVGGDGLYTGWHCLDDRVLASGSLWDALRVATSSGSTDQYAPRVMFLLRRRQHETHLTIVGDAAQYAHYARDHRGWQYAVRALCAREVLHFRTLWPPERPLSESSLLFCGGQRGGPLAQLREL